MLPLPSCDHDNYGARSRYILPQLSVDSREYGATRIPASAGTLPTKRMLIFVSELLSRLQRYAKNSTSIILFLPIRLFSQNIFAKLLII